MKKVFRNFPRIFALVVWDMISVTVACFVGIFIVNGWFSPAQLSSAVFQNAAIYFVCIVVLHTVFSMYSRGLSSFGITDFFWHSIVSVFTSAICYILPRLLFISKSFNSISFGASFVTFLVLFFLSCLGYGAVRIYNSLFKYYFLRAGKYKEANTIIYGAGELGHYLAKKYFIDNGNNRPIGFIDDNPDLHGKLVCDLRVYGGREDLSKLIADKDVKEVIVAINSVTKDALREIVAICAENSCKVRRYGYVSDATSPTGVSLNMADVDTNDLIRRDKVELDMKTVNEFITGKTVLVTGGAGSIGSEICNQILRFGAKKLIIFDINENGLFKIDNRLKKVYDKSRYETLLGSIRDEKRLKQVFEKYNPEVVFHAAAHKHVPMMEINPCEAIKNNVFGTWNTAKISAKCGVEKFILISTDKAVNPTNIMGASKRIAEMVIQYEDKKSKTSFAAVRFGNVLGSEGSVVPIFLEQIKNGGPVMVTHPEMKRYFMTIPEAVQLVLEAGAMASGGEIFVLDMGEPVLISDLAADLIRLSGQVPNKDIDIVYTGLRPGEKLFEELSLSDEEVTKTQNNKIYICKPIPSDQELLENQAVVLKENCVKGKPQPVFEAVKKLVPTFNHK